jgi:hypothetical protein
MSQKYIYAKTKMNHQDEYTFWRVSKNHRVAFFDIDEDAEYDAGVWVGDRRTFKQLQEDFDTVIKLDKYGFSFPSSCKFSKYLKKNTNHEIRYKKSKGILYVCKNNFNQSSDWIQCRVDPDHYIKQQVTGNYIFYVTYADDMTATTKTEYANSNRKFIVIEHDEDGRLDRILHEIGSTTSLKEAEKKLDKYVKNLITCKLQSKKVIDIPEYTICDIHSTYLTKLKINHNLEKK